LNSGQIWNCFWMLVLANLGYIALNWMFPISCTDFYWGHIEVVLNWRCLPWWCITGIQIEKGVNAFYVWT
jgi:hypothetical protein